MKDTEGSHALRAIPAPAKTAIPGFKNQRAYVTPVVSMPDDDEDRGTAYEVIYQRPNGYAERHIVTDTGLILGRGEGCQILLEEKFVSRQHARIWIEDSQLWIRDIGSSNGIKVNGKRVMGANISQGAELWVGAARLTAAPATGSTIRKATISLTQSAGVEDDILNDNHPERLAVLFKASQLLGTVFDDAELHQRLLELALDSVPARRGFLLERTPDGAISILAHRSLDEDKHGPPLSRALIGEALTHGDAVLTLDARNDARFNNSASIVSHEIHSAMCVPLVGRKGICGALYADSGARTIRFSEDDLTLLTAIARLAGIAIENARLHRQAIEQERLAALGMATANLGHCMKNIVTGFRCGGEFLAAGIENDDLHTVRKGWPHVARCIERIDSLVMNMLTFGRNDRRWVDTRADVCAALEQAIAAARPRADKYGVNFRFGHPERVPTVKGDTQELNRAFMNLITNSIEACLEHGGLIKVEVSIAGEEVDIRIHDTGPGIPKEIQERLFTPFYSTKGSSGTGLGLSTTQKIIHEHGGTITLESAPGEGATFIVRLPLATSAARPTDLTPAH